MKLTCIASHLYSGSSTKAEAAAASKVVLPPPAFVAAVCSCGIAKRRSSRPSRADIASCRAWASLSSLWNRSRASSTAARRELHVSYESQQKPCGKIELLCKAISFSTRPGESRHHLLLWHLLLLHTMCAKCFMEAASCNLWQWARRLMRA